MALPFQEVTEPEEPPAEADDIITSSSEISTSARTTGSAERRRLQLDCTIPVRSMSGTVLYTLLIPGSFGIHYTVETSVMYEGSFKWFNCVSFLDNEANFDQISVTSQGR